MADFRAGHSTQTMLLDDFMQGFLFALVRQKWDQFTSYAFYMQRVVEAAYLTALIWLSMKLKQDPDTRSYWLAIFVLVVGLLLFALEMVLMVLWWNNDVIHAFESFSGMRAKLHGLSLWARAFSWRAKLVGFASATAACVYYLWTAGDSSFTTKHDAPLYLLFGISSYVQGKTLFAAICVSPQLPKTGVQIIVIDKMFHNDVTTYLILLTAFTVNYFFAMYISLPVNASDESVVGHELLNGRYVDICLPFKAGWTLWHQLLLRHLNAAFERHKQNPFYHSPVVPRYVSHEGRTICNLSRLIIVRNPHERLLSYYLDKVKASCNVQGVQHCPKTTYWPSALPPKASFAETIAAINHSISSRRMRTYFGHLHYAPISEAYTERGHPCGGDTLRRQIRDGSRRVLKLEEMEHWYPPLVRELGLEAILLQVLAHIVETGHCAGRIGS